MQDSGRRRGFPSAPLPLQSRFSKTVLHRAQIGSHGRNLVDGCIHGVERIVCVARVATETWSTVIPEEKAVAPPAPVRARASASVPVTVMGSEPGAESLMAETKVSSLNPPKRPAAPVRATSSPEVLVITTFPAWLKEAVTPKVVSALTLSTTLWADVAAAIAIAVPPLIVQLLPYADEIRPEINAGFNTGRESRRLVCSGVDRGIHPIRC